MKFLLLAWQDPANAPTPQEHARYLADVEVWTREMQTRGAHLRGETLDPAAQITMVRTCGDKTVVYPHGRAEADLATLEVMQCADLRTAIDCAARHPAARQGPVSLRPIPDRGPS